MIDLNTLNINKTYVGWQIGQGFVSRLIQKLSKKETDLPKEQIATHIFMMIYENDNWYVVESHLKWHGVKKLLFTDWLSDYKEENIFCAECVLDINNLLYYIDFNPGYSVAQITKDAANEITSQKLWNDSPGVVCSELFALCENNHQTCRDYKIPSYLIKPVHVQMKYGSKENV